MIRLQKPQQQQRLNAATTEATQAADMVPQVKPDHVVLLAETRSGETRFALLSPMATTAEGVSPSEIQQIKLEMQIK